MTRKGEQTRERILSKATHLVLRQGFGATSVNDLVKATGVNRGSLYFHFPGKDDLGVAILERAREQFLAFVEESLAGETPGWRLENFFRAAMAAHESTRFVGGCLWGNTALEMSDAEGQERYVEIVGEVFSTWRDMIEEVIAAAQQCGQVRDDIPAGVLATHVVAGVEGGIMLSRLRHDAGPMRTCVDAMRTLLQLRTSDSKERVSASSVSQAPRMSASAAGTDAL